MNDFGCRRLQNLLKCAGLVKLGLVILAGLLVTTGQAQIPITGDHGSVTNNNTGASPSGVPNIAGFAPNAPLVYQWTAPVNGEVELDTIGSVTNQTPLDTVLAVFTGTSPATLNQVAANDDLFPINSSIPGQTEGINVTGSGDYAKLAGPGGGLIFGYIQPYYGPSHLRFNATAGTTYYFVVDTKSASGTGSISLHWAYKSSGVFRFATEDVDLWTGLPLYQAAETESAYQVKYVPVGNSPLFTYYDYNAPGLLVTVTRVAGSSGRAMVNYRTVDGASLPASALPINDTPAVAGVDYVATTGTLVFDDYEMSKTILIRIIPAGINGSGGYTNNTFFGIVLTNALLDPYESSISVAPPRVDPSFSLALVKILNVNADPYGPDWNTVVSTNGWSDPTDTPPIDPILATNLVIGMPTNPIVNFQKCNFRVPEDVNDTNNPNGYTTPVTIYVRRFGTNTAGITLHYRINNFLNDDTDPDEEWNNWFPLQPGSDYAVPTPPNYGTILATNSDFNMVPADAGQGGTITFAANGPDESLMPITFTVTNSTLTKFNRDFKIQLYQEISSGGATVPALQGMVAETTVTILFNDQHPPAGSVDELYNADFNGSLALAPNVAPVTTPQNDPNPGVSGVVNSLAVLPNNETIIAGDFASYNGNVLELTGNPIHNIALIDVNGQLDSSFAPNSGANGPINAVVSSPGGQFVIGGSFTSFDGQTRNRVARVNADGSLDTSFNPSGADGTVWATAVQTDGKVLIGGGFTHVNGQTRDYLARLNTDGSLDATFDPGTTLNGPVYALALPPSVITSINRNAVGNSNEDDQILNLGNFTSGTLTVSYDMFTIPDDMRIFYGDTNVAAGTGVQIYDTGFVSSSNTLVIPLGPTNSVNGLLATNIITIVMNQGGQTNITQWKYTASVAPLTSSGGILVGGEFGVSGQNYSDVARFTANGALDTTFHPISGANNTVYALGWQFDGKAVVGGLFTYFNGISANHIARLNGDGSLDTANFFVGTGANDIVWNVMPRPDGTIYVGGQFTSFNGTHRLGFTRLYANGTVDTTFLDTAYNQFAGLKRIYSDPFPNAAPLDTPAVYASGVQSDGNVMIGGTFDQVGGGQADINVCSTLDDELGITNSFADPNLWVEPKTRDGVRNRSSIARLIGGSTPGPGNISLSPPFSQNKSAVSLSVGLVRTNGVLGPVSANFSVLPELAKSGVDYSYDSTPPLYWVAWRYTTSTQTRLRSDGLFGANGSLQDVFSSLSLVDALINTQSDVTVSIKNNKQTSGNLNAQFQLANPSGADTFYLGGENIPLGAALGASAVPFTLIDDNKQSGTLGFASTNYVATNTNAVISLVRSNGTYGTVNMLASTADGTALAGTDYNGITNLGLTFGGGVVTNSFTVTIINNGLESTNFAEKFLNLHLTALTGPPDGYAAFGLSNAVLRLINPSFQGYLTLSATNYTGSESAGFINFVVSRVAGSAGQISVQYATTNGPTATNGVDFTGTTNTLQWNNGDAAPRTVTIPLIYTNAVSASKQFGVYLFNPTNGLASAPTLFYAASSPGSITNAALVISNDNSYGVLQFSAPSYLVSEDGGYATITVVRTGGTNGPAYVVFHTIDGTATNGINYTTTSGTLAFVAGQIATNFTVPILDDGKQDPANFHFNVILTNAVNAVLDSPSNAVVNILDAQTYNQPPGSPDGTFNSGMNGDVLALALQTNGQILAGGNFTAVNGTPENYLARLNANGSLDSAGFLNGLDGANGTVQAVVCQAEDSRVIIGGSFTSVDGIFRNYIARLMTDGSLDTSFNPGPGASGPVYSLAETFINGSPEIYVGGAFSTIIGGYSPNFARLNDDGTLDTIFAIGSGPNAPVYAIATYPTNSVLAGKVLIGGAFTNVNGFALNHIARLNVDGSVDTNFDLNMGAGDVVRAIVIQNDGRILIGGDFTNVFTNSANGVALNHIARLNADGTLDTGFTTNNVGGVNGPVQAIAVQADNRIVLVGQFTQANGVTRNHITRLLSSGAVDPAINFGDGANGTIAALVVQPADQMMVIGGGFTQYADQPAAHIARIYGGSVTGSGWLQFTSANYQVDENGGQALVTIERTGGTSGTNSVNFDTSDGSAVAPTNYTAVHTTVTFPPGEVLETVAVPVRDDGWVTTNLTVNLAITTNNLTAPAGITNQSTAVLTILNDDTAVSFSAASYSVTKDVATGFAPIDVVRLGTNGTCSVDFVTTTNGTATAGTDYIPTNTTITFNPGDTDKQIQVPIINNPNYEGNQTVIFALTNAVNTALFSPSNTTLTIIDTVNAPGQFSFSATNYTAPVSDGSAVITVVRTNGASGSVTVAYNTVAGTALPGVNYITTSGTLTFNNGDVSKTFTVSLISNNIVQAPISLSVVLSNPPGGTAVFIAPTTATLTLLHTNIGVAFVNATNYVRETNGSVPILVQRFGGTNGSVQVNYFTADGTAVTGVNYTATSNTLTFYAGETVKAISLPLLYDPQVTGNLMFTLSLANPSAGVLVSPSNTVIVVQDADAGLSFTTNVSSVYKNAGSAVIPVVCSNPGVEPLSVNYSTANNTAVAGVDYTATSGTLLFTGGVGTKTFSVPILNNSLLNGNHTFTVNLSSPTNGTLVAPTTNQVTIINNNSGLSFSNSTYTVFRGDVPASITVVRTENTNITSTVNFATADGTAVAGVDYLATSGTLTFANGQTSQTFPVTVITNATVQPDKTVLLQLSSPTNGTLIAPYAATLTIHDTNGSYVIPAGSTLISETNAGPPNGIIDPGETVSLLFAFRDAGGNDVTNLVATLLNISGVTNASSPQNYGNLTSGGPSTNQLFSFTAVGTNGQQIAATFQLQGNGTNLGTALFAYTLGTWTTRFSSTNRIIINDFAPAPVPYMATPYPSIINVSSVGGVVIKATVTVTNLSHESLNDVNVLLVSPSEQDTLLMSHVGTPGVSASHITLTFDDAAANALSSTGAITSGTYKPTQYGAPPNFP
jgi:uncharacterized delta-60 repeat protein